jgi:hypothetical protein
VTYSIENFRDDLRALKRKELFTRFSVPTFSGNVYTTSWIDGENYGSLQVYVGVNQDLASVKIEYAPQGSSSDSSALKQVELVNQLRDDQHFYDTPGNVSTQFRFLVEHAGAEPTVFEMTVNGLVEG